MGAGLATSTGVGRVSSIGLGFAISTGAGLATSTGAGLINSTGAGLATSIGAGLAISTGIGLVTSTGAGLATSTGAGLAISTGAGLAISTGIGLATSTGAGLAAPGGSGAKTSICLPLTVPTVPVLGGTGTGLTTGAGLAPSGTTTGAVLFTSAGLTLGTRSVRGIGLDVPPAPVAGVALGITSGLIGVALGLGLCGTARTTGLSRAGTPTWSLMISTRFTLIIFEPSPESNFVSPYTPMCFPIRPGRSICGSVE